MAVETVSALTELTSPASNDEIGIWDVSAGEYKKIQKSNLVGATITGGGTIALGGYTLTVSATGTAALVSSGTWTPNFKLGGGNAGMSVTQSGTYTRIGSVIFFDCACDFVAKGSSTGEATIEGLPFAAAAGKTGHVVISYAGNMAATADVLQGRINAGEQYIRLSRADALNTVALTNSEVTDTAQLRLGGFYFV